MKHRIAQITLLGILALAVLSGCGAAPQTSVTAEVPAETAALEVTDKAVSAEEPAAAAEESGPEEEPESPGVNASEEEINNNWAAQMLTAAE